MSEINREVNLSIRKYKLADLESLLKVFDASVPKYFLPHEKPEFEKFLREEQEVYDILTLDDQIIGAGGYRTEKKGDARICWYMIHADYHAQGYGKQFLQYHIEQIKNKDEFKEITLMTSQHTDGFYEKLGFKTTNFKKDYWGKGMDLYYMEMKI